MLHLTCESHIRVKSTHTERVCIQVCVSSCAGPALILPSPLREHPVLVGGIEEEPVERCSSLAF